MHGNQAGGSSNISQQEIIRQDLFLETAVICNSSASIALSSITYEHLAAAVHCKTRFALTKNFALSIR